MQFRITDKQLKELMQKNPEPHFEPAEIIEIISHRIVNEVIAQAGLGKSSYVCHVHPLQCGGIQGRLTDMLPGCDVSITGANNDHTINITIVWA
jgi:hypothetical protein